MTASSSTSGPLSLTLSTGPDGRQILVQVVPPSRPDAASGGKRARVDICCVIDISGSMSQEALIPADPTTGAAAESTGLCGLDIVKHAIQTIMVTMEPDDRIALVTFNQAAHVIAPLTPMNEAGRRELQDKIQRLRPSGSTNLWDGLKSGMNLLCENPPRAGGTGPGFTTGRLSALFLLTDGVPNIVPPRGHIPMLKAYLSKHDNTQPFSISTFGFGYAVDTPLLLDIAEVGGGGYGFIPDPGMVGTVFVHAMANVYATYAPRAKLLVEIPDGTEVQVKGKLPFAKMSWGIQIETGDVQFGQSKDMILVLSKAPEPDEVVATFTYRPFTSHEDCSVNAVLQTNVSSNLAAIQHHSARLDFVDILLSAHDAVLSNVATMLQGLHQSITTSPALSSYEDALALAKDIAGECLMAVQPNHHARWGRHYLPSIARSHQRQQCGNFKDPGLQIYGRASPMFIEERDKLDAAFDDLPPPTATSTSPSSFPSSYSAASHSAVQPSSQFTPSYSAFSHSSSSVSSGASAQALSPRQSTASFSPVSSVSSLGSWPASPSQQFAQQTSPLTKPYPAQGGGFGGGGLPQTQHHPQLHTSRPQAQNPNMQNPNMQYPSMQNPQQPPPSTYNDAFGRGGMAQQPQKIYQPPAMGSYLGAVPNASPFGKVGPAYQQHHSQQPLQSSAQFSPLGGQSSFGGAHAQMPPIRSSMDPTMLGGQQFPGPPRPGPPQGAGQSVMAKYRNAALPCFAGECLVALSNGEKVGMKDLTRGMEVKTLKGPRKVAAIVRTLTTSGEALLCFVGDLKVTPWHPILPPSKCDRWVFPADLAAPKLTACDAVYSVLLAPTTWEEVDEPDRHSISIAGVWCATLGHGLVDAAASEDVRAHAFFGNYEKIVNAISMLEGFGSESGVVRCVGTQRSVVDGKVCGFVSESRSRERNIWVEECPQTKVVA